MRIVASATYFPERRVSISSDRSDRVYAQAEEGENALGMLTPIVNKVLLNQKVRAEEIDLIVSLSLSTDHLVNDTSIMGPRIGHPLQKEVGASNAFVFDLMDTSLAKALHIVNTLSCSEGYKNILIVRSEIGVSTEPDPVSGFNVGDGAGVLLVTPIHDHFFCRDKVDTDTSLVIELNTNIRSANTTKARFSFPHKPNLPGRVLDTFDRLCTTINYSAGHYLLEYWVNPSPVSELCLGPLDLFEQVTHLFKSPQEKMLCLASFDPFSPSIESVNVIIGGGNNHV